MIGRRKDKVTAETIEEVYQRDNRMCLAAQLDPEHGCRSRWDGMPHPPTENLSIEHVKKYLTLGKRAPSRPAFLVLLCEGTNVAVPSKALRERFRAYLIERYPAEWAA